MELPAVDKRLWFVCRDCKEINKLFRKETCRRTKPRCHSCGGTLLPTKQAEKLLKEGSIAAREQHASYRTKCG